MARRSGLRGLIRITATGTTTVTLQEDPDELAADAAGGVWVSGGLGSDTVRHVDAAGKVMTVSLPDDLFYARDVAVAPNGSAWLAFAGCRLARVTPAGEVTTAPAPIPPPSWGSTRLAGCGSRAPRGSCTSRAAKASGRATTARPRSAWRRARRGRVSLRRLRRLGGLTVKLREPVDVSAFAIYYDDKGGPADSRAQPRPHLPRPPRRDAPLSRAGAPAAPLRP